MQSVANFWDRLFENVPDVVVAVLVLILALVVAWLVKKIVLKLAKVLGLERAAANSGIEKPRASRAVEFFANIVQLVVFVLFLPGIFDKLGLNSVSTPIVSMMSELMTYLPNIIAALLVMIIGLFIAKVVKELLVPLFERLQLNAWMGRLGVEVEKVNIGDILATVVYVVVVVLFAVEALSTLQLEVLTKIGNSIIEYLPFALGALLVVLGALILGSYVDKLIVRKLGGSRWSGMIAKAVVIVIGVFMALYQLGIASAMVNAAFVIVLGAVAVAFALSFGLGGKEFAGRMLRKLEQRLDAGKRGGTSRSGTAAGK